MARSTRRTSPLGRQTGSTALISAIRNGWRGIRTIPRPISSIDHTALAGLPRRPKEPLHQPDRPITAPHLFLGFPTRYVEPLVARHRTLPEVEHRRLRGSLHPAMARPDRWPFMSSRDGRTFNHGQAFIRPGQLEGNWAYGDNYQCWGMLETPADLPGAPSSCRSMSPSIIGAIYTIFRRL